MVELSCCKVWALKGSWLFFYSSDSECFRGAWQVGCTSGPDQLDFHLLGRGESWRGLGPGLRV